MKEIIEYSRGKIVKLLVEFFEDDLKRINHAMEVLRVSDRIKENYKDYDNDIVIACALLHDVGIKPSEEKLGYNNGQTQEEYGPDIVRDLLSKIDFPEDKIDRCAQIVGNHHSPSRYNYVELEILKEADREINQLGL